MPTRQQLFEAHVQELLRQSRSLEPAARQRILALLEEARQRVLGRIAGLRPGQTYLDITLRQIKSEIDAAFKEFSRGAITSTQRLQEQSARLGTLSVDRTLALVGAPSPMPIGLSPVTLRVAQGYTADLITALSRDARAKVNGALQRAFLGGQSLTEIIEQVAGGLGSKGPLNLFSKIGERATTISINEIKRVLSIATQERMEQAAERTGAALKKKWLWVDEGQEPRAWHQRDAIHNGANGQVREVGEDFLVGGESLAFPRDPKGSPENTINCHCTVVPHFDKEDLQGVLEPTARQRNILQDLGLEISVSP